MQSESDIALIENLCSMHAPSGEETALRDFLLDYVKKHHKNWKTSPEVFAGEGLQDNIVLSFGTPRTAAFAHMDSVGFTVRYENQLVPIGGPDLQNGYLLRGEDSLGPIECSLVCTPKDRALYDFGRAIDTGTSLTWSPDFRISDEEITSPFLDNRLGVYTLLKTAETLKDGVLVFSTWEEHGGGSVPYLVRLLWEKWKIKQMLVSDITWITDGVHPGKGVVISLRDRNIPRRKFTDRIVSIARESDIPYQLEVEAGGSSDGREIQQSPYPVDWCFIGAGEDNVHSPHETVNRKDLKAMTDMYAEMFDRL